MQVGQCPGVWRRLACGPTSADVGPASARPLDTWPTLTEGPKSGMITIWTDRFYCGPYQSLCTKLTAGGRGGVSVFTCLPPPPQLVLNTSPAVPENFKRQSI